MPVSPAPGSRGVRVSARSAKHQNERGKAAAASIKARGTPFSAIFNPEDIKHFPLFAEERITGR